MSEVAMNRRPEELNPGTRWANFFFTANYVETGIDALIQDFGSMKQWLPAVCSAEGDLRAACIWEERGHETGNPHLHGVLIFKTSSRKRPPQVANLLVDCCSLQVRPHVEICRSVPAAMAYRDKPEKAQAWEQFGDPSRQPLFFRAGERLALERGGTG